MKNIVLILAPRFPAINQPWIDTYIEQLLLKGLTPLIYTENSSPHKYSEKVDRLRLRQYIVNFNLENTLSIKYLIKLLIKDPLKFPKYLFKSLALGVVLSKRFNLAFLPTVLKIVRFSGSMNVFKSVDIVHAHSEILAFEFMLFSLANNKPLIFTFHGFVPEGVKSIDSNKRLALYSKVHTVLVNTEFAKQQVVEIGCPEEKILILPQGLPLEDFPFVPRPAPRQRTPVTLLTVGRYHSDKGQRYALLALRRLRNSGIDAYWHFVGIGPDLDKLVTFADRYGVRQHSYFHSNLNLAEILNLYQHCDLFILPSLSSRIDNRHVETQGVVLQEAQASGCIPIATKAGGIPECLHDKEDAILIRDRSSREIADAVCYLLDRPNEWARYQENGRRNVEQNFSADVIGQSMADLLTNVAQENRPVCRA